jgi:hypothetical protein
MKSGKKILYRNRSKTFETRKRKGESETQKSSIEWIEIFHFLEKVKKGIV